MSKSKTICNSKSCPRMKVHFTSSHPKKIRKPEKDYGDGIQRGFPAGVLYLALQGLGLVMSDAVLNEHQATEVNKAAVMVERVYLSLMRTDA